MNEIWIQDNVYGLKIDDWFELAKRINKNRSFLFVSKRLGKHLENESHKILYAGMLVARRLNEVFVGVKDEFDWSLEEKEFVDKYLMDGYKNEKRMVFIGFAETATGLGQSVFDRYDNSIYFHTTREMIDGIESVLNFEEEHSHDTSHRCYVKEEMINNDFPIVLVDDEITTGKTCLNIIKEIQSKYPRKEYVVASILNWMTDEEIARYKKFEKENGVKIYFVYLIKGLINRNKKELLGESEIVKKGFSESDVKIKEISDFKKERGVYIKETGRFGITSEEQKEWKETLYRKYKGKIENKKVLVVGNGEFMYIPIIMAYMMGDYKVKSTTRSPIFVRDEKSYCIHSGIEFNSVDGRGIVNYLYNVKEMDYEKVLFMVEGNVCEKSLKDFIGKLKMVSGIKEIEVMRV